MVDLGPEEPAAEVEPLTDDEEVELKGYLWELRRITAAEKDLERYRKEEIYPKAIPLLKRAGSRSLLDPVTNKTMVSSVREPKEKVVNYDRLVSLVGEEVADSVCKPRSVDTADGGLFLKAVQDGRIPMEIAAEVMSYRHKAAHVGFSSPDS